VRGHSARQSVERSEILTRRDTPHSAFAPAARPYAELDDDALVVRSKTGDLEAFREVATRYFPLIYTLTCALTGSLTRGKDLARDTFVAAWKQLPDLGQPVELRSWLRGIARRVIADFLRKNDGN
jgi:RNA polymerase sigma-70 factor (ECF subfamily)